MDNSKRKLAELLQNSLLFGHGIPDDVLAECEEAFPLTTHRWQQVERLYRRYSKARDKADEAASLELAPYLGPVPDLPGATVGVPSNSLAAMTREEVADWMLYPLRAGFAINSDMLARVEQEFPEFYQKYVVWVEQSRLWGAEGERLNLCIDKAEDELRKAAPNWVEPNFED